LVIPGLVCSGDVPLFPLRKTAEKNTLMQVNKGPEQATIGHTAQRKTAT